ncbi:MAG: hypothetical protein QHD01_26315 [Bradyrhizobium sp.]|uniref:hypothetical protein n=1 Tax=Bradyrhizobium sp. TaxID=376 RepID=UPI0029B18E9E|nr:hypothetical protein [Bradyrhizobium sp.]MDX3970094.1 hypothetical protein [Bradyrhizobium sp.]
MSESVHDLAGEIADLSDLLAILLAGPDADSATDGARLVVLEISARADRIKEATKA